MIMHILCSVYVCMYISIYLSLSIYIYICIYVWLHICIYTHKYIWPRESSGCRVVLPVWTLLMPCNGYFKYFVSLHLRAHAEREGERERDRLQGSPALSPSPRASPRATQPSPDDPFSDYAAVEARQQRGSKSGAAGQKGPAVLIIILLTISRIAIIYY